MLVVLFSKKIDNCPSSNIISNWLQDRYKNISIKLDEYLDLKEKITIEKQTIIDTLNIEDIQNYIKNRNINKCLGIDISFPFISIKDLELLCKSLDLNQTNTVLISSSGTPAAMAVQQSQTKVTSYSLPEFRSIQVTSLESWLIAKLIYQNWALFYFNSSYISYWDNRTSTKNAEKDKTVDTDIFHVFFKEALSFRHTKNKRLLDAGCGNRRFFNIYSQHELEVSGIDLAWDAISATKNSNIFYGTLEETGMPKNYFGIITAWAVFDCTNQNIALHHLLSRLTKGGVLLLTGKNDDYMQEDTLATIAEREAYKKIFPNGFTNFDVLLHAISTYGGKVVSAYYGVKRGEMALGKYTIQRPKQFYEWVVIIRKIASTPQTTKSYQLSKPFSRNFYVQ